MNVPVLKQTDPRWKNQRLGTNNAATIGGYGCAVTCVAMKNLYYGGQGLVNNVDDIFTNQGAYVDGKGHRSPQAGCSMLDWSRIHSCLPHVDHVATGFYANAPADLSRIKASIDQGHPVTLEVRWQGHANLMHFVEAVGYAGDDLIVNCPELGEGIHFSSKAYGTGNSATDIQNAHFFTGTLPAGRGSGVPVAAAVQSTPATNPEDLHMTADQEKKAYEVMLGREPENPAALGQRTAYQFIMDGAGELADQRSTTARLAGALATSEAQVGDLNHQLERHVPEYIRTFVDGPVAEVVTRQPLEVQDFMGVQPPVGVTSNSIIEVEGSFSVAGRMYLRTKKSVDGGYYYGIPGGPDNVVQYTPPAPPASVLNAASGTTALSTSQSLHAMAADGLNGWQRFLSKLNPFGGKK